MKRLLIVSVLLVSGCAAGLSGVAHGPSGKAVYIAKCNTNKAVCMETAYRTCQGAYSILAGESHAGGLVADVLPGPVTDGKIVARWGCVDENPSSEMV